jgi:hypothetical protein
MYAPTIVSAKVWSNKANMKAYCGTDDPKELGNILIMSDEAFLLIVLINNSVH